MFQKIRNRLLISSLGVFALVLAGFSLSVRFVFIYNLQKQQIDRLIALGQGAVANAEIENGQLKIEDGLFTQAALTKQQSIEWFTVTGSSLVKHGKYFPNTPIDPKNPFTTTVQPQRIKSVILPILVTVAGQPIGYVRVNEQLEEFDETILQLDIGLGVGTILAIGLSGLGSLWLNQQAMQPINDSFQRLKQFTADASHELRNPLMAISSNIEVALKYPEGMRPDDREVMDTIASATDQMIQLTEDLLLLARTDQPLNSPKTPIDLSNCLTQLTQLYRPQAENKPIKLVVSIAPGLSLLGNETQLSRAFTNLLQNAIYYTPADGQITVNAQQLDHHTQITIEDTGSGISPEDLPHIFERFWRADQARNFNQSGAGLGLAITQAVIQNHGGEITVSSQLGQGSHFAIKLPHYSA